MNIHTLNQHQHGFDEKDIRQAVIKVIGVGGGGGNAINTMISAGISGIDFSAANTDLQALSLNAAATRLQIGPRLTKGLGAGGNPDVGRNAALEDESRLQEFLSGADMVFVTAGMGGGTGTGAAPEVARIARSVGALTVGVVTRPFNFEGKRRRQQADAGIAAMKEVVDTLIVIPNQRLLSVAGATMALTQAFIMADSVLLNAVRGISDLITVKGFINVDFADVKSIMSNMGLALMGTGRATGENRAVEAATQAIESPLLEDISIQGATGILINVTGSEDMTLAEVDAAACLIQEAADEDANIIFGAVFDPSLQNEIKITVIATGFEHRTQPTEIPAVRHPGVPEVRTMMSHPGASGARRLQTPNPYAQPQQQTRALRPEAPHRSPEVKTPAPGPQKYARPQEGNRELFDISGADKDQVDIPTFLRRT